MGLLVLIAPPNWVALLWVALLWVALLCVGLLCVGETGRRTRAGILGAMGTVLGTGLGAALAVLGAALAALEPLESIAVRIFA